MPRPRRACLLLGLVVGLTAIVPRPLKAQASDSPPYEIVTLAEGVYGFLWTTAPISPEPNVLIVVNEDDVLVVDSSLFPSSAQTIVREIKKLTPKPVRYLVNTHWHDDHVFGNATFQEAWPGVHVIGHTNTRIDAADQAFGAIAQDIQNDRALLAKYQAMLDTGRGDDGQALSDERRTRVGSVIRLYTRHLAEMPNVRVALPDVTVDRDMVLYCGSRRVEIRYLGRGNTRGDLVVYLPKERIVATGDLVVAPTPFGIGSYYEEWAATLGRLEEVDASTMFLAHGPTQHDWSYVARLRRLLSDLVSRVAAEVNAGATLDEVKKRVTLADWKRELAGDDDLKQRAFDAYFVQPAVERQYRLAKGEIS